MEPANEILVYYRMIGVGQLLFGLFLCLSPVLFWVIGQNLPKDVKDDIELYVIIAGILSVCLIAVGFFFLGLGWTNLWKAPLYALGIAS